MIKRLTQLVDIEIWVVVSFQAHLSAFQGK